MLINDLFEAQNPYLTWKRWWINSNGNMFKIPDGIDHDEYFYEHLNDFFEPHEIETICGEDEYTNHADELLQAAYKKSWQAVVYNPQTQELNMRFDPPQGKGHNVGNIYKAARKIAEEYSVSILYIDLMDGTTGSMELKDRALETFLKTGRLPRQKNHKPLTETITKTKKVWHVTLKTRVPKILKEGLKPKIGKNSRSAKEKISAIYVFPDPTSLIDALTNWLGDVTDYRQSVLELTVPADWVIQDQTRWEAHILQPVPPNMIKVLVPDIDEWDGKFDNSAYITEMKDSVYTNQMDKEVPLYRNPTNVEIKMLIKRSQYNGYLRGFIFGDDVYLWDGGKATHFEIAKHIGVDLDDVYGFDIKNNNVFYLVNPFYKKKNEPEVVLQKLRSTFRGMSVQEKEWRN